MKIKQYHWLRPVINIQIAAQIAAALLPFYTSGAHAVDTKAEVAEVKTTSTADAQNQKLRQNIAEQFSTLGSGAASGNLAGAVGQQVTGGVTRAAEEWLKRFGTARVDLNATDKFTIDSGAIDLLVPVADSDTRLLFTQIGIRKKDAQITGNVGLGQRHFSGDWMFGYNAFYDQNLSRGHQRVGIGGEAWRDYLKLSANAYLRLSDWKASPDVIDFNERPADGFDLRAEAWLPAMPSLGGKLMVEQYFGNDVGLAGIANRRSNPRAVTLGVNYTPIPMLTVGLDHKRGGGSNDTSVGLQLNYALGQSWASQTDRSKVARRRSISGSRYDLVERNNNIVLEYRKRQPVKLQLPKEIVGKSNATIALAYTVEARNGLRRIDWQYAELAAAGGVVTELGNHQFQLTLPAYQATGSNVYPLSGVAIGNKGNTGTASSSIRVNAPGASAGNSAVTATPATVPADGKSTSIVKIELRDEDNNAISGMAADLKAPLTETLQVSQPAALSSLPVQPATISALQETSAGIYEAIVTAGTRAGSIQVAPVFRDVALTAVTIAEGADIGTAHIADAALQVTLDNSIANGLAANQASATVTDAGGNPLAGVPVTFTLSGSAKIAAGSSLTPSTDAKGMVAIGVTDIAAESVTVTATLANGNNASVAMQFVTDAGSGHIGSGDLTVDKTTVIANNTDAATFTAIVKDANGNPVPNISVNWTSDRGNLSAASSGTDANGRATISLTGTVVGVAQVKAQIGTGAAVEAPVVTFTSDSGSAGIGSGDLSVDKTTVIANNTDAATFTAIVKDAKGNPVQNLSVSWTTNRGNLSAASSTTDASGLATISLTGTVVGAAQVKAKVGRKAVKAPVVNFTSDSGSAGIDDSDLTVNKTTVIANNTDAAIFTAIVKDANGNLVPNLSVTWTTDRGSLSAASSNTDTKGRATISLTGSIAGAAQVLAQVSTSAAVKAPVVNFTPDSGSAGIRSGDLTVDKTTVIANNTDAATFTAIVKDANGNPVQDISVSWTTDRGKLSAAASNTDANGRTTISLTGTDTGTAQVMAQVNTKVVNMGTAVKAPVVNFVPAATVTAIASAKGKITGTGAEYSTVTATVADAQGRPVAGTTVNWATDLGSLSSATSVTDAAGKATVHFTAVLVATSNRTAYVTAAINGSNRTSAIQVRAVIQAGRKYYWTMQSDHDTNNEATANTNCSNYGGGNAANKDDLWAFASVGADFARMSVTGEYVDHWWRLAGQWGWLFGDFHSEGLPVGWTTILEGNGYVCVR